MENPFKKLSDEIMADLRRKLACHAAENDLIDHEKLSIFNGAIRLAISERLGQDAGEIDCLDLSCYTPADADRAAEIMETCWREEDGKTEREN